MKISEKGDKMPEDIIILPSVLKFMTVPSYTVPEIWHMTDVIVTFHFGLFFAFLPP